MNKEKLKYIIILTIITIAFLSGGVALGYYLSKMESNIFVRLIKIYLILFTSFTVNIIIHESGHLIFGLMTGYKFLSFRIFNLMLLKNKDGYSIRNYSVSGTGGQCIMIPPNFTDKYPYVLYNLGGIITGFIFGVICLCLFIMFRGSWFIISSFIAFFFVLVNGIPFKGFIQNDAKNIIDLSMSSNNRKVFYNLLKVEEGLANDNKILELPDELFDFDLSCENNIFATCNEMLKYTRIFASQDFDKALEYNNRLCNGDILPFYKAMLVLDRVFIMILRGEDTENIKALLDKNTINIMKNMKYESSVIRSKYAIEKYVYGDEKKAGKTLKHFKKMSENSYKKGEYLFEEAMIQLLEDGKNYHL